MYRVTARYEFEEYRLHEMFSDEYVLISPVLTEKVGKAGSLSLISLLTIPAIVRCCLFRPTLQFIKMILNTGMEG